MKKEILEKVVVQNAKPRNPDKQIKFKISSDSNHIHSEDMGDGLHFHVLHSPNHGLMQHTISKSPDPFDMSSVVANIDGSHQPEFNELVVGWSESVPGHGYGKKLYNKLLGHYDGLSSDQRLTSASHHIWSNHIAKLPGVHTNLVDTNDPESRHSASVIDPGKFNAHVNKPEKLASSEDLEKGSWQRKHPYNPRKDISPEDSEKISQWLVNRGDRDQLPAGHKNAIARGIHKQLNEAQSRVNNKTGEREYLLHRGVGFDEREVGQSAYQSATSSWTPDPKVASRFSSKYNYDKLHIHSAWVPASEIHSIPGTAVDSSFGSEKEIILKPSPKLNGFHQKALSRKNIDSATSKTLHPKASPLDEKLALQHKLINNPRNETYADYNKDLRRQLAQKISTNKPEKLASSEDLEKVLVIDKPKREADEEVELDNVYKKHTKTNPLKDGKFHHVFGSPDETTHILSSAAHPKDQKGYLSVIEVEKNEDSGRNGIKWAQSLPGKGYGKQLYTEALRHHGVLDSDTMLSSGSQKVWTDHISKLPGVKTTLSDADTAGTRHTAQIEDPKAFELAKGSWQSKHPYNPKTDLSRDDNAEIQKWTSGSADRETRNTMIPSPPNAMDRGLRKLHTATPSRVNKATGEREYLLHRGMSNEERLQGQSAYTDNASSWTPHIEVAGRFANGQSGKHIASAWVPVSQIKNIPRTTVDGRYKKETEVVLHPNAKLNSIQYHQIESPNDISNLKPHDLHTDAPKFDATKVKIDKKINNRGKREANDKLIAQKMAARSAEKLASSEDLEKARDAPRKIGEVNPETGDIAMRNMTRGLTMWHHAPHKIQHFKNMYEKHVDKFCSQFPDGENIRKQLDKIVNHPNADFVHTLDNAKSDAHTPRRRHAAYLVAKNPASSIVKQPDGSYLWSQERHPKDEAPQKTHWRLDQNGITDVSNLNKSNIINNLNKSYKVLTKYSDKSVISAMEVSNGPANSIPKPNNRRDDSGMRSDPRVGETNHGAVRLGNANNRNQSRYFLSFGDERGNRPLEKSSFDGVGPVLISKIEVQNDTVSKTLGTDGRRDFGRISQDLRRGHLRDGSVGVGSSDLFSIQFDGLHMRDRGRVLHPEKSDVGSRAVGCENLIKSELNINDTGAKILQPYRARDYQRISADLSRRQAGNDLGSMGSADLLPVQLHGLYMRDDRGVSDSPISNEEGRGMGTLKTPHYLKKSLDKIRLLESAAKAGPDKPQFIDKLVAQIEQLKHLVIASMLQDDAIDELKIDKPQSKIDSKVTPEDLDLLSKSCTHQKDNDLTWFVLHRDMEMGEYETVADSALVTKDDTVWTPDFDTAHTERKKDQPMVVCWVNQNDIVAIENLVSNTGVWGDLGSNPNADKIKVTVKPGTYRIIAEIRQ